MTSPTNALPPRISSHTLFPDDESLKDFIKHQLKTSRVGRKQLELLRFFVDFSLTTGISIGHREDLRDYPFISRDAMYSICQTYVPLKEACFEQNGGYSRAEKTCKAIIGLTDAFTSLMSQGFFNAMQRHRQHPTPETTTMFHPGNNDENYTRSPNTKRRFCPAGRLPKADLQRLYPGAHDFDMKNCFANLFINWVIKQGLELIIPKRLLLLRDDRDAFYALVNSEEKLIRSLSPSAQQEEPKKRAKLLVQKMFCPAKKAPHRRRTGCDWYDDLVQFIDSIYSRNEIPPDAVHLQLSLFEAQAIQKAVQVIGEHRFAVDKHDGFVAVQVADEDVDFLLEELEAVTDIPWACEKFSDADDDDVVYATRWEDD